MSEDALDRASEQYDQAEQEYLNAVASGADDATLRRHARQVAVAAKAWDTADAAADPPPEGIVRYYDAPEVLRELWRDLAEAHDRRVK